MVSTQRPIAVGYRRVSTLDQGKSGLGLEDQDRSIREMCKSRGLTLDSVFTEIESGRDDGRPELKRALARAKRVRGLVVVATLSRLGRRVTFVSSMMDAGTPFACADSPDDEPFILHLRAAFAEEEARKISERTTAALAMARARGTKLGNPQNLTHDARCKGAATNRERAASENAAIAHEVLALRGAGRSIRAIAAEVSVSPMTVARLLKRAGAAGTGT